MNITKKNAKAAWDTGCSDVKKVLEALFPEMEFKTPLKYSKDDEFTVTIAVRVDRVDANDKQQTYRLESTDLLDDEDDPMLDMWCSEAEITRMMEK